MDLPMVIIPVLRMSKQVCSQGIILVLREQKVLLDADLSALCGVETRALVQAVKRNIDRFLEDFVFQDGGQALISQRTIMQLEVPVPCTALAA
jgi:hypothetical protein